MVLCSYGECTTVRLFVLLGFCARNKRMVVISRVCLIQMYTAFKTPPIPLIFRCVAVTYVWENKVSYFKYLCSSVRLYFYVDERLSRFSRQYLRRYTR